MCADSARLPVAARIAPGSSIIRLAQARPFPGVNLYLVEAGAERYLVDTGHAARAPLLLAAIRRQCGDAPLTAILITHGHRDHVGGLAAIAAATGAPVYAHPAEIPLLTGTQAYGELRRSPWYFHSRRPAVAAPGVAIHPLADGEPVGPLTACHTPGHTPGHLVYWHAAEQTAICGDLLLTRRGRIAAPPSPFTADVGGNRAAAGRLLALGRVIRLCPAHGAPILADVAPQIREYLGVNGVCQ